MAITLTGTIGTDILDADTAETTQTVVLEGLGGDDLLIGSTDRDVLRGGEGDDTLRGEDGNDVLRGNQGDDVISAGRGDDVVFGGGGNDIIFGQKGNNDINAGGGNDWVSTGDQTSTVDGGNGDDTILIRTKKGADHIITGGAGADTFEFVQLAKSKVSDVLITDFELGTDSFSLDGEDGISELADFFFGGPVIGIDEVFEGPNSMIQDIVDSDGAVTLELDTGDSITLQGVSFGDLLDFFFEGEGPIFIPEIAT